MGVKKSEIIDSNFSALCRKAAAQGAVLLKNADEVLPLLESDNIVIFGRCQKEYYRSGTGSGGAVNVPYTTNLLDSLRGSSVTVNEEVAGCYERWLEKHPLDDGGGGWACEPWCQQEMPVEDGLAARAAAVSNKAIVVIGRTAGEDKDNSVEEGSYLLTAGEKQMLWQVCSHFKNVIVILNVSNIIDMSFLTDYEHIKAVVYAWQGGMEGGNGIADVLTGAEVFQGKLTDTIARDIAMYPSDKNHGGELKNVYQEDVYVGYRYFESFAKEEVLFPFGYGLSYTEFAMEESCIKVMGSGLDTVFLFTCKVRNIGKTYSGRETVQVYVEGTNTGMGRPAKELIGFAKTKELTCDEETEIRIEIPIDKLASYDDSGVSGYRNSYVLESGEYVFFAGTNVRDAQLVTVEGSRSWQLSAALQVMKCQEVMAPIEPFRRMCAKSGTDGTRVLEYEDTPMKTVDLKQRIQENQPLEIAYTGSRGLLLKDIVEGRCSMEEFIAQFSAEDLSILVRGEGMCSAKVTPGTASVFGGVAENLLQFGVPAGCCADGPSGIRMDNGAYATQVPIGTLLACTWDEALVEKLFSFVGEEMLRNQIDALLGPGINIHRHPLNGRNFEYFSEDPLLAGKMAAAVVRGIGQKGVYATVKHFACNSQEMGRHIVDAVVSQRALREIYLKAFEIAVKEGGAKSIMTSYNPINGYWSASNYDLNTTVLRKEWGFDGIVMTDWWADLSDVVEGGNPSKQRTADMLRAQNDIYMVVNNNGAEINAHEDDTIDALETGRLTMGELQRSAMNICRFLMNTPAVKRERNASEEIPFIKACSQDGPQKNDMDSSYKIKWGASGCGQKIFYIESAGMYDIIAKMRYGQTDRAQSVCKSILNGKDFITFQTNGTEGRWIQQKLLRVQFEKGVYELALQFPKPGMEIDYIECRPCNTQ